MLKLFLLGPPRVELNDRFLKIRRRKALALLVYLAVSDKAHSRDALATLFYPELDQSRARAYFRRDLGALNNQLEGDWISADRDLVGLKNTTDIWIDAQEFHTAINTFKNHDHVLGENCLDCQPLLSNAVNLYQDDFLAGFSLPDCPEFDSWQYFAAEDLRQELAIAVEWLSEWHLAYGQYDQGLNFARKWLNIDPLNEAAHRLLMKLYALAGQYAAALRQYEYCASLLDEELSVSPDEETVELYKAIKEKRFSLAPMQDSSGAADPLNQLSLPLFLSEDSDADAKPAPFVAREREIAQLDAALDSAREGDGQILFVIGGAGRGKSMLVQEFAKRANGMDQDLMICSGNCDAITGIGDPYLPFREALSMLTGDVESMWASERITTKHARRLWDFMPHTLPALVDLAPDLINSFVSGTALAQRALTLGAGDRAWFKELQARQKQEHGPQLDQARIFTQYTSFLKEIASEKPLVLIIEDLHWVDKASSGLLFHLSRELGSSQILIIGTYRPEELSLVSSFDSSSAYEEHHPMASVVSELKRQHGDIWLDLGDLAAVEGRHFVEAYVDMWPNALGDSFREALFQRTEGHALFTAELLRDLRERGDLVRDEQGRWFESEAVDWASIPVKVEGVIEKRINRLPEALQTTLNIASIEGENFTAEVVARVQGLAHHILVQQLSRGLDRRHRLVTALSMERLEPGGQRLSVYRFRHQLFQQYLYYRLDEVERGYLHEAVGQKLEQLYGDRAAEIAAQLAHHFQMAGIASKAISYSEQAGNESASVHAHSEAAVHYARALELINRDTADSAQLIRLYDALGRSLELDSKFDQALANYEAMEQLGLSTGNKALELAALIHQGRLYCTTTPKFDADRGAALSERGLRLAQEQGDELAKVKIQLNLINLYRWTNRSAQAIEVGEDALSLIKEHGQMTLKAEQDLRLQSAYILNDLAHCYFGVGNLPLGMNSSLMASEIWSELDNKPMRADSLATASYIHGYAGEFERAVALANEAQQISETINNIWGQSYSQFRVGVAHWELGQVDLALNRMQECLRLSELSGFIVPQVFTRTDLAMVYGRIGMLDQAVQHAQQALSGAETQLPTWRAYVLGTLAQLYLKLGKYAQAEDAIARGKKDPYRESYVVYYVPVPIAEARLTLLQQEYKQALAAIDALLDNLRSYGMRIHYPEVLCLKGEALWHMKQFDEARYYLLEAQAEALAMNARSALWPVLSALSSLESDPLQSERLRIQAKLIVEHIAERFPTPALRKSFLSQKDVRAIT